MSGIYCDSSTVLTNCLLYLLPQPLPRGCVLPLAHQLADGGRRLIFRRRGRRPRRARGQFGLLLLLCLLSLTLVINFCKGSVNECRHNTLKFGSKKNPWWHNFLFLKRPDEQHIQPIVKKMRWASDRPVESHIPPSPKYFSASPISSSKVSSSSTPPAFIFSKSKNCGALNSQSKSALAEGSFEEDMIVVERITLRVTICVGISDLFPLTFRLFARLYSFSVYIPVLSKGCWKNAYEAFWKSINFLIYFGMAI